MFFKVNHYPTQPCSSDLYSCLMKRLIHSLRLSHGKGDLIPARKQVACKLPGTKGSVFGPKRVSRPLLKQNCTHSSGQHHSYFLHKQRKRHEVGPPVCPILENPDLVFQKAGHSQGLTHSRPAECGCRQAIQARSDHPNRVVSPSRGLPVDKHQVGPTSDRPVCTEVQQVTSVCVTSSRIPSLGNRCT